MSYGRFVHEQVAARTRQASGRADVEFARGKRAADEFADWPEPVVVGVLADMHWPQRPVGHAEVRHLLKARVSPEQRRRWLLDEEGWQ